MTASRRLVTRRGVVVAVGLLVGLGGTTGCAPEPPTCVGEEVEGDEHVVDVPSPLSGGERAVATLVDMTAEPRTASLTVMQYDGPTPLNLEVSVGTTVETASGAYEVTQVCAWGVALLAQSG